MEKIHPDLARVLISQEQIQTHVEEMAAQISSDFSQVDRLYIIGILKGAFIFLADLTRRLSVPHIVDFMALSSYGKSTSSGAVRILMDLREPIEGQAVLVVEDIVDSGHTLHYLHQVFARAKPGLHPYLCPGREETREPGSDDRLPGFYNPGCVGGGLWPGLRRPIPHPALCGRAEAGNLHCKKVSSGETRFTDDVR